MRVAADHAPVAPSARWEINEGIPLPGGRGSHAGGVIGGRDRGGGGGGGRVVVAGGTTWNAERTKKTFLRESLWFDRGIWQRGPDLPVALAEGAYASDTTGLYLAGGYVAPDTPSDVVCRIVAPPGDGELRCETLSPLPQPMAGSAAAIFDGELIIAGGYVGGLPVKGIWSLALAAPDAKWRKRADLPGEPRAYSALARHGQHLYLLGGLGASKEPGKLNPLRDVHRFDPRADKWERMADLPVAGYCWSAEPLDDGRHLLLTGRADGTIHRDIFIVDVADISARRVGETVVQTTCAPLVRADADSLWLLGGEPDSNKTRTPRVTVIRPPAPASLRTKAPAGEPAAAARK